MLLKYFYDKRLAHASYLVGCQKAKAAIIIDPGRDIDAYLQSAREEGMQIVGAADTHIHADYVSGARELAETCEATLYLSDEGPAEWKYQYADRYEHKLVREGDSIPIGRIELKVIHTPGHTPESVSFLLVDRGGGATTPMGIFTGDFVFVGSIGRPDLLEQAAGMAGTAVEGAKALYQSVQRFHQLPDHLQVWPAHGAGSACGKGLGSIPSSTVGYEKLYNPALQFGDEDAFVDYILAEQPEAPRYFAVMKRVNKEGPPLLAGCSEPVQIPSGQMAEVAPQNQIIDTRSPSAFAKGHAPNCINIPIKYLAAWAGWLVDYERPTYLVAAPEDLPEVVRILRKIGIDDIAGYSDPAELEQAGFFTQSYEEKTPSSLAPQVTSGEVILIDVRGESEWREQRIPQAKRCFLAELPNRLSEFRGECTLAFQCRSGGRSAIAASLAKAAGVENVVNLTGGIEAWGEEGLEIVGTAESLRGPGDEATIVEGAALGQAVFWDATCSGQH